MRFAVLSDLHFGRARPDLVDPLLEAIDSRRVDMVLIAGDFVQRARAGQFDDARRFLERLRCPWFAVPGNHDIPLFNLVLRILDPRGPYRKWIATETEPLLETPDGVVVGVDTTHRWRHQRGKIRSEQIERVARIIRERGNRTVLIVAHHPFHQSEDIEKKLMLGAPLALETWADAGPHVILSGHLHRWTVEPFVTRRNQKMTLQVHCGTGLSTRIRGEPNEFAVIEPVPGGVVIERLTTENAHAFEEVHRYHYASGKEGWRAVDGS